MPSTLRLLTVPLALAALLFVASTSQADSPIPDIDPLAFEEEFEIEDEGEFELEECEAAEEEFEEGVIAAAEVDIFCEADGGASAAADKGKSACALRSAKARAVEKRNKLKVTVGYTTSEPLKATIQIRQGKTTIGSFKRRLGKSGVLRFTEKLSEKLAGKRTVVKFKLPSGSAGCPSRRLVLFPR